MVSQSRFRLLGDKGQFAPTDACRKYNKNCPVNWAVLRQHCVFNLLLDIKFISIAAEYTFLFTFIFHIKL